MSNAYRDENNVPTLIASSNVDGKTPIRLYADPITHRLLVDLAGTGITVYTEILTDSGDHKNFTSVHNITNIFSIMDAYSGKGIPASNYSVSTNTLTLTSADANLASDTIQLIYA